jgi:hypothetical protein
MGLETGAALTRRRRRRRLLPQALTIRHGAGQRFDDGI